VSHQIPLVHVATAVNVGADQARTDTWTFVAASNTSSHAHEADEEEASSQPNENLISKF
jgi:hypothetical protein